MSSPPPPIIQAAELVRYGYCRRAWWLGTIKKIPPQAHNRLRRGQHHHQHHHRQVQTARRWQQAGLVLTGLGLIILLIWLAS